MKQLQIQSMLLIILLSTVAFTYSAIAQNEKPIQADTLVQQEAFSQEEKIAPTQEISATSNT